MIKTIAEHYGLDSQLMIMQEEAGELIQAVSKYQRFGAAELDHLLEEIADIEIMTAQIKHLTDGRDRVESIKQAKLRRQLERIEAEAGGGKS